jgi:aerobic-type carbon monoxide dehydrogenase small subunit (CoxS/CutS family)
MLSLSKHGAGFFSRLLEFGLRVGVDAKLLQATTSKSRRMGASVKHFCPFCSSVCETFDALKAHVLSHHQSEPVPTPDGLIQLTVNGQRYQIKVEPEWTLYDLIHDKMFCDRGICGSCTVIMDRRAILSCMTLAIECGGKSVETVEEIARNNPVLIEKYAEHHAMQCGYCTPGFVVTAKALLDKNPSPTEDEIKEALAGNLCRCGTYPQHPKAILEAASVLYQRFAEYLITSPPPSPGRRGRKKVPSPSGRGSG